MQYRLFRQYSIKMGGVGKAENWGKEILGHFNKAYASDKLSMRIHVSRYSAPVGIWIIVQAPSIEDINSYIVKRAHDEKFSDIISKSSPFITGLCLNTIVHQVDI